MSARIHIGRAGNGQVFTVAVEPFSDDLVDKLTDAFLDAIPVSVYVDDDWPDGSVLIDGKFSVHDCVRAVLHALRS